MITDSLKNAFWAAVADCLAEFHHRSRPKAVASTFDLRMRLENPPEDVDSDLIYHSEPFEVASNLAEEDLDISKYRQQYDLILERHFGSLPMVVAELPRIELREARRFG